MPETDVQKWHVDVHKGATDATDTTAHTVPEGTNMERTLNGYPAVLRPCSEHSEISSKK